MWRQQMIQLAAKPREFHLISDEIIQSLTHLNPFKIGFVHLLLQHTSASLTLNENCDPTVRFDMENHFQTSVPERANYQHDDEGDMICPPI